ncbi:MAG TPA: universal stress protein [Candidatus Nanoarchaeia archaeon]|nr:universal stress protein [Candidatus Nanoarchaeia archaeon]
MKKFSSETIQKILVPTDGSDYSMRAAEYAISIAKTHDAQITITYVIDEVVIDQFSKPEERETVESELKTDGQRYIHYVIGLAEKEAVKSTSMLVKGRPFEQIVNLAKSLNVDLIVMGTYGRRGAERILIGSVAERVIEYSPCPVLVVK